MSPALQKKVKFDQALTMRELAEASGYGYSSIRKIDPPMLCGKCRLSSFWKHVERLSERPASSPVKETQPPVPTSATDSPRLMADRLRAPRRSG